MFVCNEQSHARAVLRCAGVAVLEAIEEDKLQQNADDVGTYLIHSLQALQKVHPESCWLTSVVTVSLHCFTC